MNHLTPISLRENMEQARDAIAAQPQAEYGSVVCCGGGMFARTIFLKAGQALAGRIHKLEHINIMSYGDISVATEDGPKRLTGFNIMACKPGSRRIGLVHADTAWTTILKTDETDLEKVEAMFFVKSHTELEHTSWLSLT